MASRSFSREDITVSTTEVPLNVHRTDGTPPVFAGFRQEWMAGEDDKTGVQGVMYAGAGVGSPYLLIEVTLPGGKQVHEYVDMTEFFDQRAKAISAEHGLA